MTRTIMIAAIAVLAAGTAHAKGHDQGSTDDPGRNVKEQTVVPAQGLGDRQGNSGNTPAAEKRSGPK